ncbi:MAG: MaoC/PaaZ C-terminal domain-containing protein [Streptosporangiaceae bacterium]
MIALSYLHALTRRRATSDALPAGELVLSDVVADRARLARYAQLCGFPAGDTLPPVYPHVLAFPAALALLTRRDFPLPALGLVHVANRVTARRPIGAGERLTLRVRAADLRGTAFDIVTRVSVGEEPVWESASTYLHREPGRTGERSPTPLAVQGESMVWPVPVNTGRRYAAVSGDRNPIHLHALTARMFGFRTAIAHGMWAKARALAALGPPGAFTAEVAFRSPIALPSSVRLVTDGRRLALTTPDGERTHLYGSITES